MSRTIKAMRVLVSGKVQGVFYRASTLQEARDLELTGWVRNLEDGRVECKAIGKETDLLTLLHWMGKGPIKAKVSRVDVEWLDYDKSGMKQGMIFRPLLVFDLLFFQTRSV